MLMITLYAEQKKKRHGFIEQSFRQFTFLISNYMYL